jgi:6-phosphogluconolactonase (cycloisomerase 2 family)
VSSHAYSANVEPAALSVPDAPAQSIVSFTSVSHFLTHTATLFAAQSNGNLSTLQLTQSDGSYSLSVVSNTWEAGENPSWLNIDLKQRLLYCLDRGHSKSTKGSLNSFRIGQKGSLNKIDSVEAPFSGVAAEYIDLQNGKRGYICAS